MSRPKIVEKSSCRGANCWLRRIAALSFAFTFFLLLTSCPSMLQEPEYDNPFDPKNPDSPFHASVEASTTDPIQSEAETVTVVFAWSPVDEATGYEFQWTYGETFDTEPIAVEQPQYRIDGMQNDTTVRWRVRYHAEALPDGGSEPVSAPSGWFGPWSLVLTSGDSGEDSSGGEDNGGDGEPIVIPTATISVDGSATDWNGIEPVGVDDGEDAAGGDPGTDIREVYIAKDEEFLYWRMDVSEAPTTGQRTYRLYLIQESSRFPAWGDYELAVGLNWDGVAASLSNRTGEDPDPWRHIPLPAGYAAIGQTIEVKVELAYFAEYRYTAMFAQVSDNNEELDRISLPAIDYRYNGDMEIPDHSATEEPARANGRLSMSGTINGTPVSVDVDAARVSLLDDGTLRLTTPDGDHGIEFFDLAALAGPGYYQLPEQLFEGLNVWSEAILGPAFGYNNVPVESGELRLNEANADGWSGDFIYRDGGNEVSYDVSGSFEFDPEGLGLPDAAYVYEIPTGTITVDGDLGDWGDIEPQVLDDAGDSEFGLDHTDIRSASLAQDENYLYWRIYLGGAPDPAGELVSYRLNMITETDDVSLEGRYELSVLVGNNRVEPRLAVMDADETWQTIEVPASYGAADLVIEGKLPLAYFAEHRYSRNWWSVWSEGDRDVADQRPLDFQYTGDQSIPEDEPPGPVTNLSGEWVSGNINLTWSDPPVEDLHRVEVTWSPGDGGPSAVGAGEQSISIPEFQLGTGSHDFVVTAIDGVGYRSEPAYLTVAEEPTGTLSATGVIRGAQVLIDGAISTIEPGGEEGTIHLELDSQHAESVGKYVAVDFELKGITPGRYTMPSVGASGLRAMVGSELIMESEGYGGNGVDDDSEIVFDTVADDRVTGTFSLNTYIDDTLSGSFDIPLRNWTHRSWPEHIPDGGVIESRTIAVDGEPGDWWDREYPWGSLIIDHTGDSDYSGIGGDVTGLRLAADSENLYFLIDLADGTPSTTGEFDYRVWIADPNDPEAQGAIELGVGYDGANWNGYAVERDAGGVWQALAEAQPSWGAVGSVVELMIPRSSISLPEPWAIRVNLQRNSLPTDPDRTDPWLFTAP